MEGDGLQKGIYKTTRLTYTEGRDTFQELSVEKMIIFNQI